MYPSNVPDQPALEYCTHCHTRPCVYFYTPPEKDEFESDFVLTFPTHRKAQTQELERLYLGAPLPPQHPITQDEQVYFGC